MLVLFSVVVVESFSDLDISQRSLIFVGAGDFELDFNVGAVVTGVVALEVGFGVVAGFGSVAFYGSVVADVGDSGKMGRSQGAARGLR